MMTKLKIYFLLLSFLLMYSGLLKANTTIRVAACEGGMVTLEIPDCKNSYECCIRWIDLSTNLYVEGDFSSCSITIGPVLGDSNYKAIITKDNLGSTEECLFEVKQIVPGAGTITVEPKDCCYNAGEPISLDDFNISYSFNFGGEDLNYGVPNIQVTGVTPTSAKIYPDKQIGQSFHKVTYSCNNFMDSETVVLNVVNEEVEIPELDNFSIEFNVDYKKNLKNKLDKPSKYGFINHMLLVLPDLSLEVGVEDVTFKKCCKETPIRCIANAERRKITPFQVEAGASADESFNTSIGFAEIVKLLEDIGVDLPFDVGNNKKFDIEFSVGVVTNVIPEFSYETGCEPTLKECLLFNSTFKVAMTLTPKSIERSQSFFDVVSGIIEISITWPQELKYCRPGGEEIEVTSYGCPTITIEGKPVLMTFLEIGGDISKEEFFPSLFGVDCQ